MSGCKERCENQMECCNCGSDKHVSYSKHCKYIKEEWNRRNKTYTDILEAANQPNNKKSKMVIQEESDDEKYETIRNDYQNLRDKLGSIEKQFTDYKNKFDWKISNQIIHIYYYQHFGNFPFFNFALIVCALCFSATSFIYFTFQMLLKFVSNY